MNFSCKHTGNDPGTFVNLKSCVAESAALLAPTLAQLMLRQRHHVQQGTTGSLEKNRKLDPDVTLHVLRDKGEIPDLLDCSQLSDSHSRVFP